MKWLIIVVPPTGAKGKPNSDALDKKVVEEHLMKVSKAEKSTLTMDRVRFKYDL